ncbi:MAG: glycosyltransferase family 4 protein [Anaerolineae bacterium]|nr:glycosyltransferase family 4 protein [Anaerolineae bacterium]
MKIGLVIYGSLDTPSGEHIYDQMVAGRLQEEGDEVEVISLPWQSNYALRLADNLAEETFERLRDASFDLLLQDAVCHSSLFHLNRRLHKHAKYPIIAIVQHLRSCEPYPFWQSRFYHEVERHYLATADGFIFSGPMIQNMVEEIINDRRPAVVACPAGDRLGQTSTREQITRRVRENGPLRVLFVGNLIPRTGLHILLDALIRLKPSSWHLTIAGSAAIDRVYARLIADLLQTNHLLDCVTHTGFLDSSRLVIRYASSHVLVSPSLYEGFGIPCLEGMSFGLPVIAGTVGAIRELVTHGADGFLIPHGNAAALAKHLQVLIDDRDMLLGMSLAARARFDAQPTWEQSTGLIRRFLQAWPDQPV